MGRDAKVGWNWKGSEYWSFEFWYHSPGKAAKRSLLQGTFPLPSYTKVYFGAFQMDEC
jgi:hypothetical protein